MCHVLFAKKFKKICQIWPRRPLKHFTAAYRGFQPCTQSQHPINRETGYSNVLHPPPPPCTHVTSTPLRVKAAPFDGRKCCGVATMAEAMCPSQITVEHGERKISLSRSWCSCSSSGSLHHVCSPSGSSTSSSKDWDDSEIDSDECFE